MITKIQNIVVEKAHIVTAVRLISTGTSHITSHHIKTVEMAVHFSIANGKCPYELISMLFQCKCYTQLFLSICATLRIKCEHRNECNTALFT